MALSLHDYLDVPGREVHLRHTGRSTPTLDSFRGAAPWLRVASTPSEAPSEIELVGSSLQGSMRILGSLEGRLGEPLAEALRALATGDFDFDSPVTLATLREIEAPIDVVAAVTPSCPFCPRVASMLLRFAAASDRVSVTIVRTDDPRAPRGISSVPSVLVAGRVVASGGVGEYELARALQRAN